jgi:hypothetical protein
MVTAVIRYAAGVAVGDRVIGVGGWPRGPEVLSRLLQGRFGNYVLVALQKVNGKVEWHAVPLWMTDLNRCVVERARPLLIEMIGKASADDLAWTSEGAVSVSYGMTTRYPAAPGIERAGRLLDAKGFARGEDLDWRTMADDLDERKHYHARLAGWRKDDIRVLVRARHHDGKDVPHSGPHNLWQETAIHVACVDADGGWERPVEEEKKGCLGGDR